MVHTPITSPPAALPARKYLADALHEVLPQLGRAYARDGRGKNLVHFLQGTIVCCADEGSLQRIVRAVHEELARLEGPGRDQIVVETRSVVPE